MSQIEQPETAGGQRKFPTHYFWFGFIVLVEAAWFGALLYMLWRLTLWTARLFGITD